MKLLGLLSVSVMLASCASAPERRYWPLVPPESAASKPFAPDLTSGSEMADLKTKLIELRTSVSDLLNSAGAHDWSSGDATTAGGLMAVVGQIAEKVGLRNTGLGVAALAYTGRERFQFPEQRMAYVKASDAFTCLQQVVNQLSDREREIVLAVGQPAEQKAASNAPLVAVQGVEFARAKLERDLRAVSAAPPDRAALVAFAKRYAEQSEPAASAPGRPEKGVRSIPFSAKNRAAGDQVPEWQVQEALNKAKAFEGELGKCRHE